jgi:hypothetical protein
MKNKTWKERVEELEREGCTRSDAQAVADVEFGLVNYSTKKERNESK